MMSVRQLILAAVVGTAPVLLSACTQVPGAATYPLTYQPKMQSVAHWQVLAEEVAAEVAQTAGKRPVYVQPQETPTVFGQAYHNYLVTELIRQGVATGPLLPESLTLRTETQVVAHQEQPVRWPTGAGTLAGAVVGFGSEVRDAVGSGAAYLGAGLLTDVLASGTATPSRTELIVTTSLQDSTYVWNRASRTFYVLDKDWKHYEPAAQASTPTMVLPPHLRRVASY